MYTDSAEEAKLYKIVDVWSYQEGQEKCSQWRLSDEEANVIFLRTHKMAK